MAWVAEGTDVDQISSGSLVSSRTRSSAVTVMEIPLRITDNRTKPNLQKLLFGLFCQVLSTRNGAPGEIRTHDLCLRRAADRNIPGLSCPYFQLTTAWKIETFP